MKNVLLSIALLCMIYVPAGEHHIVMVAHYAHMDSEVATLNWSSVDGMWVDGPGIADVSDRTEGEPVGYVFWVDMTLAGACGNLHDPYYIFIDGFENRLEWWK